MELTIKHAGKTHLVPVDPTTTTPSFKDAIYRKTGVPVDRMKVMVKGKIVKDDTDFASLNIQPGQAVTVIGSAGPLPEPPAQPIVFLEDMDDSDLAAATGMPVGLVNLGQTCYLASTLQSLRVIPQIRGALDEYSGTSSSTPSDRLAVSLKNLYSGLDQTTSAVAPLALLSNLRTLAPQFAERDNHGHYMQQDADEAWTQILSALRASLPGANEGSSVVDQIMTVQLTRILKCAEAPDEPATTSTESSLKISCNISINTNYMMSGILDSFNQQIEKTSPTLGRMAAYSQVSRISRLPTNLVVHMVRFYWRRDIQKKAKIMRKVKFPLSLDAVEMVTDELRQRMLPVNTAVKQIVHDRDDRAKVIKRNIAANRPNTEEPSEDSLRAAEKEKVEELIKANGGAQVGENLSGMYELYAMVTHKGASADSGHYIGWARKDRDSRVPAGEEEWYKFDDDKVSVVKADKILSMDGGGEDSVAYILLYRAVEV